MIESIIPTSYGVILFDHFPEILEDSSNTRYFSAHALTVSSSGRCSTLRIVLWNKCSVFALDLLRWLIRYHSSVSSSSSSSSQQQQQQTTALAAPPLTASAAAAAAANVTTAAAPPNIPADEGAACQVRLVRVQCITVTQWSPTRASTACTVLGKFLVPKCREGTTLTYRFDGAPPLCTVLRYEYLSNYGSREYTAPGKISVF